MQGFEENEKDAGLRWRVTTSSGDQFACSVRITGALVEVQLTTGEDEVVCVRAVPSAAEAGPIVHRWLRAVVAGSPGQGTPVQAAADVVH